MVTFSPPSTSYYHHLISLSSSSSQLLQILSHSIVSGHRSDLILTTHLLSRLPSLSSSTPAPSSFPLSLFSSVHTPDLFLLHSLLCSLPPLRSLSLLSSLPRLFPSLPPNNFIYSFTFSSIASSSSSSFLSIARTFHARSIIGGFSADPFVGSSLIRMYFNFKNPSLALKVFDGIPDLDIVSWNSLISGLVNNYSFEKAMMSFFRMIGSGIGFDWTTLAVVLRAVAEMQDLMLGLSVHGLGLRAGLVGHSHVVTGLISVYSKCGEVENAELLFGGIDRSDLVIWNAMISGYSCNGRVECSVGLFKELMGKGMKPSSVTMVGLIPVSSPFGHESLAQSIHGFVMKSGFDGNSRVSTAIVTIHVRLNDMDSARLVFDTMPEKTMEAWNVMISGYAKNGLTEMSVDLFREMQSLKVKPNPVTMASILSACAQLGALSLGKWAHQIIDKEETERNIYVSTALIDMYAKCGKIEEARRIFDSMEEKNVVSWNAMIYGYGIHGQGLEAINLFREMVSNYQICPTGVTFISILNACSHGGLVEEGQNIFHSMDREHGIRRGPEHYACMVDILGRAGKLEEALEFIEKVSSDTDPGVWRALLGACMIHKKTKLAQLASKRLFELEPDQDSSGYYVLLSNIYSANRNYPKAAIVREALKSRRIAKTPGCTLIEINDRTHTFTSGDRSHPMAVAIYAMLEKITEKMVEAGYRVETDAALYDVEEEEKESMVRVHSEKLAIAFGLISTEPGSEVRIIKNLRVCLDCHSATKFISKVTKRVIVVRDAKRFHHFRDGECSCGDYW